MAHQIETITFDQRKFILYFHFDRIKVPVSMTDHTTLTADKWLAMRDWVWIYNKIKAMINKYNRNNETIGLEYSMELNDTQLMCCFTWLRVKSSLGCRVKDLLDLPTEQTFKHFISIKISQSEVSKISKQIRRLNIQLAQTNSLLSRNPPGYRNVGGGQAVDMDGKQSFSVQASDVNVVDVARTPEKIVKSNDLQQSPDIFECHSDENLKDRTIGSLYGSSIFKHVSDQSQPDKRERTTSPHIQRKLDKRNRDTDDHEIHNEIATNPIEKKSSKMISDFASSSKAVACLETQTSTGRIKSVPLTSTTHASPPQSNVDRQIDEYPPAKLSRESQNRKAKRCKSEIQDDLMPKPRSVSKDSGWLRKPSVDGYKIRHGQSKCINQPFGSPSVTARSPCAALDNMSAEKTNGKSENELLNLLNMTALDLHDSFKKVQEKFLLPHVETYCKQTTYKIKRTSNLPVYVMNYLLTGEQQITMMSILRDGFHSTQTDFEELFWGVLMPEWCVAMVMDTYGYDRDEAIKQIEIRMQISTRLDDSMDVI